MLHPPVRLTHPIHNTNEASVFLISILLNLKWYYFNNTIFFISVNVPAFILQVRALGIEIKPEKNKMICV